MLAVQEMLTGTPSTALMLSVRGCTERRFAGGEEVREGGKVEGRRGSQVYIVDTYPRVTAEGLTVYTPHMLVIIIDLYVSSKVIR